ncbi:MAG: SDR family NAD(P)-dependent oxidoreductase, partial [Actinomycetota bacterium]|nr:SDR family NAD(P)-dependent oxidoreductase [Actinomycetota bacterium]
MSRNKGRVVIVTGAGSGIGKAAAARFHSEGAMVVAVDLTDASLEWVQGL